MQTIVFACTLLALFPCLSPVVVVLVVRDASISPFLETSAPPIPYILYIITSARGPTPCSE